MFSGLSGYIKGVKNALQGPATQAKPTLGRIRVGNREVEEIKLISQGGYAYVFQVRDTSNGEIFALKKMICQSPERFQTAKNEIKMLRALPNHPNLLRVFDSSIENIDNCYYVYVLLEFCDGGSIFDLMAKYESTKLSEKQIIFIMREVCEGVKVLHSCKPPIAHRDLKIENVLLRDKRFKLCDFGSCSTSYVDFSKVPQSQYATYEEEYEKNTTLMYRPPEMCDPYQRQIVCEKADVWMLGCILYTMCFYKHPFQEMTKLSIVNAAYSFPNDHPYPAKLVDLIRIMLTPTPTHRPSVFEICDLFKNYFDLDRVKLNPDAQRIKEEQKKQAMEMGKFENSNSRIPKFDGDIPIEELMKLQKKLKNDDDESPVHQFQQRGNRQQQQQQPQQFKQNSSKPQHFDSFDSFGQQPKRQQQQQPNLNHFNSSPGIQPSNDWADFKNLNNNHTPKQNSNNNQWNSADKNAQPKQLSSFAQGNHGNQGLSNNQNNQPVKSDNRVNDPWNNFNFNSSSSNGHSNNNNQMNNSGNSWATNNWGGQNQQSQPFNAFNSAPSNNAQANNVWNNFGGNSGNMNNGHNHQAMNGNMMNQPQNSAPVLTNDLLDLADTSAKSKTPNIMALYSMSK